MLRIAVNGYGRIGRGIVRALFENNYRDRIQVVAINELADLATVSYLTRYDSTHGRFPFEVTTHSDSGKDYLQIDGETIRVFNQPDVQALNWHDLDVDVVLECTGAFQDRSTAELHIRNGASKVLFSQPASSDVDATVVYGVNHHSLTGEEVIVSNASCTTNCIIPVLKVLDDSYGIVCGTITTIHSAMNDQPVIDAYHSDLRRTRSAGQSIIPVDTGLAAGIERVLPEFKDAFVALHMRVPTQNVSLMDLTVELSSEVDVERLNQTLSQASKNGLAGVLGYTEEPHASIDFNHDSRSGIVDGTQTRVVNGKMAKLVVWFDNEWAFANRMLDTALTMGA
ncbi:glyceraldehyde 3-phosphate dehydrogenase NAD-binding domain-containing protein [Litoribacillus peritrichatus]|uniref:Erythrose-4-phosphate dehydrogenase n=1 Tax=Litoribacillus peritrichatus TaxID=718191 RepID=A0ABP7MPR8_9GAMM